MGAIYSRYSMSISSLALSVLFARINGLLHGQQCMVVGEAAIIPDWNVTRMKRKLTMTMFWEMTVESKLLKTNFNDLGIILFRRQCFIWWNQNIFEYESNEDQAFRFFSGHPVLNRWIKMHNNYYSNRLLPEIGGRSGPTWTGWNPWGAPPRCTGLPGPSIHSP